MGFKPTDRFVGLKILISIKDSSSFLKKNFYRGMGDLVQWLVLLPIIR